MGHPVSVQVSVVTFNKGFSNCIVNVHIHSNLLLDNKRAITGLRGVFTQINHKIQHVINEHDETTSLPLCLFMINACNGLYKHGQWSMTIYTPTNYHKIQFVRYEIANKFLTC